MALGDLQPYAETDISALASRPQQVKANGSAPAINAGEPVGKTLGNQYVITLANAKPVVGTDFMAGISLSTSSETSAIDGTVQVVPVDNTTIWLVSPNVAATYGVGATPNQTTYNALVGARVLIQVTTGVFTLLAADSANNGCVVENLDVVRYPGKVAFSFRSAVSYLA